MDKIKSEFNITVEDNVIKFYYIIKNKIGTKIRIELPDNFQEKSELLLGLTALHGQEIEDFDQVCLTLLQILPGDLAKYRNIKVLYDNSNNDRLGNVDLDNTDDYYGDIFEIVDGAFVCYADSRQQVIIRPVDMEDQGIIYSCYVTNGSRRYISSIFEEQPTSRHVTFSRNLMANIITTMIGKKGQNAKKKMKIKDAK